MVDFTSAGQNNSSSGEISYLQLIPASSSSSLSPSPSTASPEDHVMDSIEMPSPGCGGGASSASSAVLTVKTSGTNVKPKEVVLVSLAFLLLAFSISLFFRQWKKNYWDINHLQYWAQCYEDVPAAAGAGVPGPPSAPMSAGPTAGSLAPTFFYQPPPPPPPPSSAPIPSSPVAVGRAGTNSSQRHLLTSDYFGSGGSSGGGHKRNLNSDTISLFDVACTLASSPSFRRGAGLRRFGNANMSVRQHSTSSNPYQHHRFNLERDSRPLSGLLSGPSLPSHRRHHRVRTDTVGSAGAGGFIKVPSYGRNLDTLSLADFNQHPDGSSSNNRGSNMRPLGLRQHRHSPSSSSTLAASRSMTVLTASKEASPTLVVPLLRRCSPLLGRVAATSSSGHLSRQASSDRPQGVRPKAIRLKAVAKHSSFSQRVRSNPQSRQASIQTRSSINEEPSRTGSPLTPTTAVTAHTTAVISRERHSSVKCVDSKSGEEYEIVIASASNSSSNNNDDDIGHLPDDFEDMDDVRSIP